MIVLLLAIDGSDYEHDNEQEHEGHLVWLRRAKGGRAIHDGAPIGL